MKKLLLVLVVIGVLATPGMSLEGPDDSLAKPGGLTKQGYNYWAFLNHNEKVWFAYGYIISNIATVSYIQQYNPEGYDAYETYKMYDLTGKELIERIEYIYSFPELRELPLSVVCTKGAWIIYTIENGGLDGLQKIASGRLEEYFESEGYKYHE